MDKQPEEPIMVSICCIVYNHAPYLHQCFDGFVMQKTTFPIEILVHDDASTDGSADIIREYTAKYPHLFKPVYQTENQYSKNVPICATFQYPRAKGKYIAMCEGDDYWTDPYKLQKQVDFLEANLDYVLSFHDSNIVDDKDNIIATTHLSDANNKDLEELDLKIGNHPPTQTIVFRTASCIKEIQNLLKSSSLKNGDTILCSLIGKYGKGRYQSEIKNSAYRIHSGGVFSSISVLERDIWAYNTYTFLQKQHLDISEFFVKKRYDLCAHIITHSDSKHIVSKFYRVFLNIAIKRYDFKRIYAMTKVLIYKLIHKSV